MNDGQVTVMPQESEIIKKQTISGAELVICQITALEITDEDSFALATELGAENRQLQKNIEAVFKDLKQAAHEAHSKICKKEKLFLNPLLSGEKIWKQKVDAWFTKQEEEAAAEKVRLEKIALKDAETERKRLLAIAERATSSGNEEKAEAAREQAEEVDETDFIPPPAPVTPVKKTSSCTSSVTRRSKWVAKVVDKEALIKAVAAGEAPQECLIPDMKYLGGRAKLDKTALKIPGVKVRDEGTSALRV